MISFSDDYYISLLENTSLSNNTKKQYINTIKKYQNEMTIHEIIHNPYTYELSINNPKKHHFACFLHCISDRELYQKWKELVDKYDIKKEIGEVVDWWLIIQKTTFDNEDEKLLFDMHRLIPPLRSGDLWKIKLERNGQPPESKPLSELECSGQPPESKRSEQSLESKPLEQPPEIKLPEVNRIVCSTRILHMVNYKTCGTYGELKIKLDDRIILPDREYLFNFKTRSAYTIWANSVVKKYFPTMTLHKFRHSFLRSKMFLLPNPIIARMMGHSMEQQLIYAYGYQFSKWYTDVMEWKCPW